MTMNPVVHFELPAEDSKRMSDFYTKAFGWQTDTMGPGMNDYVVVTTTENGGNRRPKQPGAINGGFFKKSDQHNAPSLVIAVDDMEEAMRKVEEAGGKLIDKPYDIPGVGLYISFIDTEGNTLSLLQPSQKM
jgi:predicted enzyme related to lactoylglutathione lyase